MPEIISALNRRLREKNITRQDYSRAKQSLFRDARDATIVNLTPDVIQLSIGILEANPVRTMDALHVACAITSGADLFVSSDQRQLAAAHKARLKTGQV